MSQESLPAGSVAHRVNREVVLLLGWGRAILLQVAHPLVAAGVADHSGFLSESHGRWRRLRRTLDAMLALTFGPPDATERAGQRINALHERIHGRLREPAGVFAAGTPYSACDPTLLRWVHATVVDSFLLAYEFYAEPLAPREKDRYCAEAAEVEPRLRIPAGYLPRDLGGLRGYLERMMASGEISVTPTARRLAREIVPPPVPFPAQPLARYMELATVGLLPAEVRRQYAFSWGPRQQKWLEFSARAARRVYPRLPGWVRHWPAARAA